MVRSHSPPPFSERIWGLSPVSLRENQRRDSLSPGSSPVRLVRRRRVDSDEEADVNVEEQSGHEEPRGRSRRQTEIIPAQVVAKNVDRGRHLSILDKPSAYLFSELLCTSPNSIEQRSASRNRI